VGEEEEVSEATSPVLVRVGVKTELGVTVPLPVPPPPPNFVGLNLVDFVGDSVEDWDTLTVEEPEVLRVPVLQVDRLGDEEGVEHMVGVEVRVPPPAKPLPVGLMEGVGLVVPHPERVLVMEGDFVGLGEVEGQLEVVEVWEGLWDPVPSPSCAVTEATPQGDGDRDLEWVEDRVWEELALLVTLPLLLLTPLPLPLPLTLKLPLVVGHGVALRVPSRGDTVALRVPEADKEGEGVTEGEKEPDKEASPLRLVEGEPDPPGLPLPPFTLPVLDTLGLGVKPPERVTAGHWEGVRVEEMHEERVLVGERVREGDLD